MNVRGKVLGIFGLLVAVVLFTGLMNPRFFSADNLENVVQRTSLFGILGIGAALTIVTGGIDLSIGAVVGLAATLLPMMIEAGVPAPAAVLGVLGVGALLGAIHGLLITRVGLQPFVVTLCGLLVYRGVARQISGDQTLGFGNDNEELRSLATGSPLLDRLLRRPGADVPAVDRRGPRGALPRAQRLGPLAPRPRAQPRGRPLRRRSGEPDDRGRLRPLVAARGARGRALRPRRRQRPAGRDGQLLRALRHRRGGARRLQPARRRGLDPRRGARRRRHAAPLQLDRPARDPEPARVRHRRRRPAPGSHRRRDRAQDRRQAPRRRARAGRSKDTPS